MGPFRGKERRQRKGKESKMGRKKGKRERETYLLKTSLALGNRFLL